MQLADNEILMSVVEALVTAYPNGLILKGSLALNTHLGVAADVNHRFTSDSDFYLIRSELKFAEFENTVRQIISKLEATQGLKLEVSVNRHPKNHSAGKIFIEKRGRIPFFSIDVDVDECVDFCEQRLASGFKIQCASIESICADKIDAISKPKVLYRVKDLYDIYLISLTFEPEYRDVKKCYDSIYRSAKDKERLERKETFKEFKDETKELRRVYDNSLTDLKYVNRKPSFDDVYIRTRAFIKPFVTAHLSASNAKWDIAGMVWIPDTSALFGGKMSANTLQPSNIFSTAKKQV